MTRRTVTRHLREGVFDVVDVRLTSFVFTYGLAIRFYPAQGETIWCFPTL